MSVDFFPLVCTIEVTILIDQTYTKRVINIDKASLLPIQSNLLILWRNPLLVVLIDCKYAGQLLYLTTPHITALSMPFKNNNIVISNVNHVFYRLIRPALIHVGCVNSDFIFPIFLNATAVYRPTSQTASSTTNQVATTNKTTTSVIATTTTTTSSFIYTNNSLPYLTNDFTMDSNFILLIYSARVSQYKNLLDLTKFLNYIETIDQRLLNLSSYYDNFV